MAAKEECKMLHQSLAEFLRQQEIRRRRLLPDREEDFVGCVEPCETVDAGTELRQDGHGVGKLPFDEERNTDIKEAVAGSLVGG